MSREVPAERVRLVRELVRGGMKPYLAARQAGVSLTFAYGVDREMTGVCRRSGKPAPPRSARRALLPGVTRLVLDHMAAGMNPRRAAAAAGVSDATAYRLRTKMGGVCRPPGTTFSGRYLDREERYEIARLREAGLSQREIGRRLGRSPSAICRELARNADPKTGRYLPGKADRLAWQRQRRPKASKLSRDPVLRAEVQRLLDRRYSPEQVSGRLKVEYPDDEPMRVSHETIYQSICLYPRGELKRELRACTRTGRQARRPRGRREMRGKIVDAVPIGQRPAEAQGRLVPGHHEGDLVMGSKASNSAVGTIVERSTGYLTLLHLPDGHDAASVADAVIDRMSAYPAWFTRTLTWDRGTELAQHKRITAQAGIQVYFADPYSPWQRGSNENINGLLREYLPKGTDLNAVTPDQLRYIQDELNDRPRKRFGYHTPREQLAKLLEQERVATTP